MAFARPSLAVALLLAAVACVPAASASELAVDASAVQAMGATVRGRAAALDLRAPTDAPGALRIWLQAGDLVIENDWANSTYVARTPVHTPAHDQEEHPLGPGRLEAASTTEAGWPRILVVPLGEPLALDATAASVLGAAATDGPSMANPVPNNRHDPVTADVGGSATWTLEGGRLAIDGSFLLVAWAVDLSTASEAGLLEFPTGERLAPFARAAPDAAGYAFDQQVHAIARDAHLEVDLSGPAQAVAYLGPASVTWSKQARLDDVRGVVPAIEGVDADGAGVTLAPGRLEAGAPRAGRLPVEVSLGEVAHEGSSPATQASLGLASRDAGWLLLPLLGLALLVPGAGLPWLRRQHARRFASVEHDLEAGRLEAAADGARRLVGSRWFGVDAAIAGAEACLRAGDPRQALAFLDGRPWRPAAQGLRLLMRARAQAMQGETATAGLALGAALESAPDLRTMAGRDPLLSGLLDASGREAYA